MIGAIPHTSQPVSSSCLSLRRLGGKVLVGVDGVSGYRQPWRVSVLLRPGEQVQVFCRVSVLPEVPAPQCPHQLSLPRIRAAGTAPGGVGKMRATAVKKVYRAFNAF
jgi:hypothetical protein